MLYSHWPQSPNRHHYQDDEESYYSQSPSYPGSRPPQTAPSSRRRPNPQSQETSHPHFYHRHRDDRDAWPAPGPAPDGVPPQLSRRQPPQTTASASDYGARPRSRRGRSSSATRAARSKSTSPRRHATPLPPAPPIPQLSLSERETLVRQRLRSTFETHVFNTLPTQLLRVTDMSLVTRNEVWDTLKPRVESIPDSHLAKLLLEQDEEARKLGVSVMDPDVLAPFTNYVRTMISYAVFSHKEGSGEPQFHEMPSKRSQVTKKPTQSGPGYQKLFKFCDKARTDYGCEYVWTDTCCINKESSAELEEAILSAGLWYSEATICIVHLTNSQTLEDFMTEPWFGRCWTLQELLLSRKVRFYGKDWSPICPVPVEGRREDRTTRDSREEQRVNDKDNEAVVAALTKVTGIPEADIRHFVPSCSRVSEKMGWASRRTTARTEDMAYSLLGLFDVTIPIRYGEGARAFYNFMSTLADQYTEPDLFAWSGKPSQWSLALPSSPQCYGPQVAQGDLVAPAVGLGDPAYELTKLGLRIRLVLVPAYCEPLEPTDAQTARYLLTPALATVQESIQIYVPLATATATAQPTGYGHGHGQGYASRQYRDEHEHDPREVPAQTGRGREYALGVVDYDVRAGPHGYAALHAGRPHLCLVLEKERRGRGWVRVAKPGALSVRFRESELFAVESVCLLHRV